MKSFGQIYKFTGNYGLIRPKEYGQSRIDVLFLKHDYNFKIGDNVSYKYINKNGRRFAVELEKV